MRSRFSFAIVLLLTGFFTGCVLALQSATALDAPTNPTPDMTDNIANHRTTRIAPSQADKPVSR